MIPCFLVTIIELAENEVLCIFSQEAEDCLLLQAVLLCHQHTVTDTLLVTGNKEVPFPRQTKIFVV